MVTDAHDAAYGTHPSRCKGRVFLAGTLLLVCALLITGCAGKLVGRPSSGGDNAVPNHEDEQILGIKILGVRSSSAGYMLDLRFRIIDSQKAALMMNAKTRLFLVDQRTGSLLGIPDTAKLGVLRQFTRTAKTDHTYFVLFANPGQLVKSGGRVNLLVDKLSINNLVVDGVRVDK